MHTESSETEKNSLILKDKAAFDAYVYSSLEDALQELARRKKNIQIDTYLEKNLQYGIPNPLLDDHSFILFRHVATPNYEINRFMALADAYEAYSSYILEYHDDMFNDRNENKYFLGKLRFQKGHDKNGNPLFEHKRIINFNDSNNRPLSSIMTELGESLINLHHRLFRHKFPAFIECHYDISDWLHKYGKSAREYYKPFLSLFLKNGILFENFLIAGAEAAFTYNVVLPALREIEQESGFKPLIVNLEPTHVEADSFWLSYPYELLEVVEKTGTDHIA